MRNKGLSNPQKQALGVLYRAKGWVPLTNGTNTQWAVNQSTAWALQDMGLCDCRFSSSAPRTSEGALGEQARAYKHTKDLIDLGKAMVF